MSAFIPRASPCDRAARLRLSTSSSAPPKSAALASRPQRPSPSSCRPCPPPLQFPPVRSSPSTSSTATLAPLSAASLRRHRTLPSPTTQSRVTRSVRSPALALRRLTSILCPAWSRWRLLCPMAPTSSHTFGTGTRCVRESGVFLKRHDVASSSTPLEQVKDVMNAVASVCDVSGSCSTGSFSVIVTPNVTAGRSPVITGINTAVSSDLHAYSWWFGRNNLVYIQTFAAVTDKWRRSCAGEKGCAAVYFFNFRDSECRLVQFIGQYFVFGSTVNASYTNLDGVVYQAAGCAVQVSCVLPSERSCARPSSRRSADWFGRHSVLHDSWLRL